MLKYNLSTLSGFRTLAETDALRDLSTLRQSTQPQLWGGIECTVNRVGDRYFDQLERSGHAHRSSDLELFAGLGLKALRYPVLWERIAPGGVSKADWNWPDERL